MKLTRNEIKAGILKKCYQTRLSGFVVCIIEADKILCDDHQRNLNKAHEKEIREEFDCRYVSMPRCTFRMDGQAKGWRVYNEDGNHTVNVVIQKNATFKFKGKNCVECLVHFKMDGKEAAKFFCVANTSPQKVNALDSFFAGVKGEKTANVAIFRLFKKHKLTTKRDTARPDMKHISEYLSIFNDHGEQFFADYCKMHAQCLKGIKHKLGFLRGLIRFITNNKTTPTVLCDVLDEKMVRQINEHAAYLARTKGGRQDDRYKAAFEWHLGWHVRIAGIGEVMKKRKAA